MDNGLNRARAFPLTRMRVAFFYQQRFVVAQRVTRARFGLTRTVCSSSFFKFSTQPTTSYPHTHTPATAVVLSLSYLSLLPSPHLFIFSRHLRLATATQPTQVHAILVHDFPQKIFLHFIFQSIAIVAIVRPPKSSSRSRIAVPFLRMFSLLLKKTKMTFI